MKRISLVIALLLATQFIFAQSTSTSVSAKEAMRYGMYYFSAQYPTRANLQVKSYELLKSEATGKDCYHVFNYENGGWAIICADKRGIPVLAYNDEDEFIFSEAAPAAQEWINHYMQQLDVIEAKNIEVSDANLAAWNQNRSRRNVRGVEALLTTKWNQDYPYNMLCPEHPQGNHGHTYTGCVATAMAQVMKYWEWPRPHGFGSATYFWGQWDTINFAEATYDWEHMQNTYGMVASEETKKAVALLMFHCGVSINMDYGYEGSSSATEYTVDALRYNFGYRNGINYKARDNGGTTEENFEHFYDNDTIWCRMIIEDLDMRRPIIYTGRPESGAGHAWVCDGYRMNEEGTTEFHMNWGWGGSSNAWYTIDNLQTHASASDATDYNFTYGQGAVFNIAVPNTDSAKYCMSETNVYEVEHWDINDGSYGNNYKENTNCDWLIKVRDYATDTVELYFNYYDLAGGDALNIYAGEDENGRVIARYTENNTPGDTIFKHVGTPIYIQFMSDAEEQARGWEMHYEALRYPYTITTTLSGVGYDTLHMNYEVVNHEVVKVVPVMDNSTYTVAMKAKKGYTVTEFTIDGIVKLNGAGQDLDMGYTFTNIKASHTIDIKYGPVSVDENTSDNISIYPNPNNGKFSINFGDVNAESYVIFDMSGRVIEEKALNGSNTADFDMNIASGTYFIKVISTDKTSVKKIVIE